MLKKLALISYALVATSLLSLTGHARGIFLDGEEMINLQEAFDKVTNGGIIRIEPGIYREGGTLKKGLKNILITGSPGTIFDGVAVGGKAAFVIQAEDVTMESIECRNIKVPSQNGACIRHEGGSLTLRNMIFRDNENGILTWSKSNIITIEDSLFERNGKSGRAHGMYIDSQQLIVRRTRILNSKDQGHGIKSRSAYTLIEDSVVASLNGDDSYLIDIPNGGRAVIRNCLLVEGANTVNTNIFTFGPEGLKHEQNRLVMEKNIIISDREDGSYFMVLHKDAPKPELSRNFIVGPIDYEDWPDGNFFFDGREDLKFPPAPELPEVQLGQ